MLQNLWYVFLNIYTSTVFLTTFWCNELTWFIPHVYHNGRTHSFSFELAVKLSTCWKIYGMCFCTYTPVLFYLTSWCSELTWFIPHVYHNGRTHSFSFEFGSETEHMLKNLWYAFYTCWRNSAHLAVWNETTFLSSSRLIW